MKSGGAWGLTEDDFLESAQSMSKKTIDRVIVSGERIDLSTFRLCISIRHLALAGPAANSRGIFTARNRRHAPDRSAISALLLGKTSLRSCRCIGPAARCRALITQVHQPQSNGRVSD